MLTRNQLLAFVMTLMLVSVVVGFFATVGAGVPPIRQSVDGVSYVKTRDAGWQPEKGGDYADTLFGGVVQEYGLAVDTTWNDWGREFKKAISTLIPASLPNTSGQCGEDSGIACE